MALELEMKLRIPSDKVADRIFETSKTAAHIRSELPPTPMLSRYYDTPDNDITSRHWSLRLRREGDRDVATLKTRIEGMDNAQMFCRNEWQVPAPSIEEGIKLLVEDGAPAELLEVVGSKPLVEQCRVEFTRHGVVIELPDNILVDVTVDKGSLIAGDRSAPLHELEVELLFGNPDGLKPFVDRIIEEFDLEPELLSKYERALRLVRSREPRT